MESATALSLTSNGLPELAQKDRKGLWIFGETESKRRVILIEKKDGSYGFTLQSYGVRYKHGNRETDFITYVNAVEKKGAAYEAGLREGDVILSINGQNMARVEHKSLVSFIRKCPQHLKMVVVSDERARKVELHMRYVHLQKKLHDKMKELEELNWKEKEIMAGICRNPCGSPLDGPCISTASTVCCFCPPGGKSKESKENSFQAEPKKTSKPEEKLKGSESSRSARRESTDTYDCYRKTQSSRELHQGQAHSSYPKPTKEFVKGYSTGSMKTPISKPPSSNVNPPKTFQSSKQHQQYFMNSSAGEVKKLSCTVLNCGTMASTTTVPSLSSKEKESAALNKPKSWDNLITTKSFGGYGFGFGYGYYPLKNPDTERSGCHGHVTHPHHHNHHNHRHCSHSHTNYYNYKKQHVPGSTSNSTNASGSSGPKGSVGSSHHQPITHTTDSGNKFDTHTSSSSGGRYGGQSSIMTLPVNVTSGKSSGRKTSGTSRDFEILSNKGLPSLKSSSSKSRLTPDSFSSRMDRTLSDSSLNSEHHKDFPKSMSYFNRSIENVSRYSSDNEDYEQYAHEDSAKHDIYV